MWPLREGGRARASVGERRSFVLSLSLSEGVEGAHNVLVVFVGLRGEEEFHDFGVTLVRGVDERRVPIQKERTEREGARRGGGGQPTRTHITRVSEERGRETEARWGGGYMGGPRSTCARAKCAHTKKTIPTELERFRDTNAKQMHRSSLRLKPRILELFSDRISGHVLVVNQNTDLSPQRADTRGFMPKASRAHVAPS
jgi:hypothetical protein